MGSATTCQMFQPQVILKENQILQCRKMKDLPFYPQKLYRRQIEEANENRKASQDSKCSQRDKKEKQSRVDSKEGDKARDYEFTEKYLEITQNILAQPKQCYFNQVSNQAFGVYRQQKRNNSSNLTGYPKTIQTSKSGRIDQLKEYRLKNLENVLLTLKDDGKGSRGSQKQANDRHRFRNSKSQLNAAYQQNHGTNFSRYLQNIESDKYMR